MLRVSWVIPVVAWFITGCATLRCPGDKEKQGLGKDAPKTLLRWAVTKDKDKENGDDKDNTNSKDKQEENGKDKENGNGKAAAKPPEESDDIVTDRPTFTPASRTIGLGHVQLETGYTLSRDRADGVTTFTHSYPEAELRIGAFANWFEFRITQNFLSTVAPARTNTGATDLLLGAKLWLTEKDRILPETALILQTYVPSGAEEFTNRKALPGMILIYSWDLLPDRVSFGGSSQANTTVDGIQRTYLQIAQSLVLGYTVSKKLSGFTEWYALFPSGATTGATPQYFFDSGFTYKVLSNVQLDIRAGLGLNHASADFLAGAGFSYRY